MPTDAGRFRTFTWRRRLPSSLPPSLPPPSVAAWPTVARPRTSERLIPDNCYHGHGLAGARLQITATSCSPPSRSPLPPCPATSRLRRRDTYSKGFPRCPYLGGAVRFVIAFAETRRNERGPPLVEAGKFMGGLCPGIGKYCFFQSTWPLAHDDGEEEQREKSSAGATRASSVSRVTSRYADPRWNPDGNRLYFLRLLPLTPQHSSRRGWEGEATWINVWFVRS